MGELETIGRSANIFWIVVIYVISLVAIPIRLLYQFREVDSNEKERKKFIQLLVLHVVVDSIIFGSFLVYVLVRN